MTAAFSDDTPGGIDWNQTTITDTQPSLSDELFGERDGLPYTPDDPLAPNYAQPSPDILKAKRRANGAIAYQNKVNDLLTTVVSLTASNTGTVTDAAAILIHGQAVSVSLGDLAAENDKVAQVIDFLAGGNNNPMLAVVTACAPLVLQVVRNHEPQLESITKINLPGTKGRVGIKLPSRLKFKLGRAKAFTNDPSRLYDQAFNDRTIPLLEKKGIHVAAYVGKHSANRDSE